MNYKRCSGIGTASVPPASVEAKDEIAKLLALVGSEDAIAKISKNLRPYVAGRVLLAELDVTRVNRGLVEVGLL